MLGEPADRAKLNKLKVKDLKTVATRHLEEMDGAVLRTLRRSGTVKMMQPPKPQSRRYWNRTRKVNCPTQSGSLAPRITANGWMVILACASVPDLSGFGDGVTVDCGAASVGDYPTER